MTILDRAYGALLGLAIGDALGMPTQYTPRSLIAERYGILDSFQPGPDDNFISRGMAAGRVTDDTDQAVILGELLVAGQGAVDPELFASRLLAWEKRMIEIGSHDLLGPSTRAALTLVAGGMSTELTGRSGSTNGAAMRVAPVGIAFPAEPLSTIVDAVFQTGHVTHNTTVAIAGASAVAAAVSAGIDGASVADALVIAIEAAKLGAKRGFYFAGGDVAARSAWALDLVRGQSEDTALDLIYRLVGTGVATNEAVPAALAICAVAPHDPWRVCCLAASLGGDCDTVGAIAGAIMGACHGASAFPADQVAKLNAANPDLTLEALAADLLTLRTGQAG
ncbi:ADP-ribosylglycohydrolase family protein [Acidisoma silvae]|uniref:ADP-ribosylglycohydrolase family protein n=1 Tax=Acidisoma silvae TaxID=2802396 RepID=A0A963YRX6_9PROT|nr:ADP-ribosylglycohydrolase family protein [Acidisoma silvae]MCB8875983.1 ADP-ribosylglycohydrolase family protein [Acidisoma silvae]